MGAVPRGPATRRGGPPATRSMRRHAGPDRATHAGAAEPAIAHGILGEILLMVVLGEIEFRSIDDLGRDDAIAFGLDALLIDGLRGLGGLPLRRRVHVDSRAILRPDIVALAHPLGRIVALPEHLQQ